MTLLAFLLALGAGAVFGGWFRGPIVAFFSWLVLVAAVAGMVRDAEAADTLLLAFGLIVTLQAGYLAGAVLLHSRRSALQSEIPARPDVAS